MSGFALLDSLLLVRLTVCLDEFLAIELFWNLLGGVQDRGVPDDFKWL